jgi:hypothetical protein
MKDKKVNEGLKKVKGTEEVKPKSVWFKIATWIVTYL